VERKADGTFQYNYTLKDPLVRGVRQFIYFTSDCQVSGARDRSFGVFGSSFI
jgi:hypothetical protein